MKHFKSSSRRLIQLQILFVVWIAFIGCSSDPVTTRNMEGQTAMNQAIQRSWPSLAPIIRENSNVLTQTDLNRQTARQAMLASDVPFVYLKWRSPYRNYVIGDIYYVDTGGNKTVVWDQGFGGTTPSLWGNYVYFIKILNINWSCIPPCIRNVPVRYNIITRTYEELAEVRENTPGSSIEAWNYLVPFGPNKDFLATAIGFFLTGECRIYKNGVQVYKGTGSFLMPDVHDNYMYCGRKRGGFYYCVELWKMNISTRVWTKIKSEPTPSRNEFYETDFAHAGNGVVGFCEFYYNQSTGGGLDMRPHIIKNNQLIPLPQHNERWSNGISISRNGELIIYPCATYNESDNYLYLWHDSTSDLIATWTHMWIGETWFCNSEDILTGYVNWNGDNACTIVVKDLNPSGGSMYTMNPGGPSMFVGFDKNKPSSI